MLIEPLIKFLNKKIIVNKQCKFITNVSGNRFLHRKLKDLKLTLTKV